MQGDRNGESCGQVHAYLLVPRHPPPAMYYDSYEIKIGLRNPASLQTREINNSFVYKNQEGLRFLSSNLFVTRM